MIFDPKRKKSTYWNPESRLSCRLFCCPTETVCEYEVQYHRRLEQERAQWNQYRESVERELAELRRRLTEGQEEQNLEDEMKKVDRLIVSLEWLHLRDTVLTLGSSKRRRRMRRSCGRW